MNVAREVTFDDETVRDWCERAGDHNPLHLDESAASNHAIFDQRIVPGILLLDHVSGLVTQWAEVKDGSPILLGLDDVLFLEAVPVGNSVDIVLVESDTVGDQYELSFTVEDSDTEYASGSLTVMLE